MTRYCLSIHASYQCAHAGACCTAGWPIPAETPLIDVLTRGQLGPAWTADRAFEEEQGPEGKVRVLRTRDGHGCVFHEPGSGRCAVHRQAGPEALPIACRNFPRITLHDRRGVFITLSHFCPTAAGLLLQGGDLAIVEAPPSLSLHGSVEGLDATGVLPPLLRPGMLADADGYGAWEREAVATLNERRLDAGEALAAIAAATDDTCTWQPGAETLAARVADSFERARARTRRSPAGPAPDAHAIKSFLAAHLFGSWSAYQDGGITAIVRAVDRALMTLTRELSRTSFIEAARAADFHLRHSRTDVRPRPLSSLRRH